MLDFTQTWAHDRPIYFVEGIRVSLEVGYNVALSQGIEPTRALKHWLDNNMTITPSTGGLYIADYFDAPCFRKVAQRINGNDAVYLHSAFRRWKNLKVRKGYSTHISKFGIESTTLPNGKIRLDWTGKSTATYEDGAPREWQSCSEKSTELYLWHYLMPSKKKTN